MKWFISALLVGLTGSVSAQANLQVDFRWLMSNHCNNTSPALKLKNIPPGTTSLQIQMIDLDNNKHDHGGGELVKPEGFPAEFLVIAGSLDKYKGPCPENFTTLGHEYQFNVSALNADNKTLASASAKAPFSAKFVILQGVIGNQ
ncbi:MAG: hypothetical protein RLZZ566_547 [Pseudomonadota bacterium]|jgi:phosphatidylethanolamine-binding protein (PEBP) family uncharacterized protein